MDNRKKLAFIFPGQGAQTIGMGQDFAAQFPIAKETFQEADDLLSYALSTLIFKGSMQELILTKNCQVAIYVASMAIMRVVREQFPMLVPEFCAGLSLGEYTALTASGKLAFTHGVPLVRARGEWMQEACEAHPGTMLVALGMLQEDLQAMLDSMPLPHEVWIANLNCPGQIVIAGTKSGIARAQEHLKTNGVKRLLPLDVAGAFHSPLMEDAKRQLEPMITDLPLLNSSIDVIMNVVGLCAGDADQIRKLLIKQVTSPVLWEKGVRSMEELGVVSYIEIGPGKTLTGMNKRIGVSGHSLNIEKVEDLEKLKEIGAYATT
jgi:[acyl-carrier-protein] S-malonyltransferase